MEQSMLDMAVDEAVVDMCIHLELMEVDTGMNDPVVVVVDNPEVVVEGMVVRNLYEMKKNEIDV